MRQIAFNTLKFVEMLVLSGIPEKQAKAQAEAIVDTIQMNLEGLATKQDLTDLRHDLRATETRLQHEIRETDNSLKRDLQKIDHKIDKLSTEVNGKFNTLYWMFTLILASMGTIIGKLLLG